MPARVRQRLASAVSLLVLSARIAAAQPLSDPLPSWNDSKSKRAVVAFVERVTKAGSPDFVPAAERIATFDNDGTLWAEQPMYFQLAFALDKGLDEARARGWTVVDMKADWNVVYPSEKP